MGRPVPAQKGEGMQEATEVMFPLQAQVRFLRLRSKELPSPPFPQVTSCRTVDTFLIRGHVWLGVVVVVPEHTEMAGSLGLTTKPPWKRLKNIVDPYCVLRFSRYSVTKADLSWSGPWRGVEPARKGSLGGAGQKSSAEVGYASAGTAAVHEGNCWLLAQQQLCRGGRREKGRREVAGICSTCKCTYMYEAVCVCVCFCVRVCMWADPRH